MQEEFSKVIHLMILYRIYSILKKTYQQAEGY